MRQNLRIPRLDIDQHTDWETVQQLLHSSGREGIIGSQTWSDYAAEPGSVDIRFFIGYHDTTLCVLFRVEEPEVRATWTKPNDPVFEDSCVECFIGDGNGRYLNVECNPFGAVLAGMGTSRNERTWLGEPFFSRLKVWTSLDPKRGVPEGTHRWEALLRIPLDASGLVESGTSLPNGSFAGNLYKCGDLLSHPHYISWSPILLEEPDFHQSEYFAPFVFID